MNPLNLSGRRGFAFNIAFLLVFYFAPFRALGEVPFTLKGFLCDKKGPQINIADNVTESSTWLRLGDKHSGWAFQGLDVPKAEVTFQQDNGTTEVLRLQDAIIKPYREQWIRSRENPMFFTPTELPVETQLRWSELTPQERSRIEEFYRRYGWNIKVISRGPGHVAVMYDALHEPERRKEINKMFSDFQATLPPDNARLFEASRVAKPMKLSDGPPTSMIDRRSLVPPDRKEEYDRMIETIKTQPKIGIP